MAKIPQEQIKRYSIVFSSLLDTFGLNAEDSDDVVTSETAQIYHTIIHNLSYIHVIVLRNKIQSFTMIKKLKQNYLMIEPSQRHLLRMFLAKKI